jgi:hypothetical protein
MRTLAGLALTFGMVVLLGSFFRAGELGPSDWATLVGLVGLGLVLIPALALRIDRAAARGRVSTKLLGLRRALEDAAPARAELLEQLAKTLAELESLGDLQQADRDRVVARLRAASSRGPALSRAERDRLVLDLEICETLIAPEKPAKDSRGSGMHPRSVDPDRTRRVAVRANP